MSAQFVVRKTSISAHSCRSLFPFSVHLFWDSHSDSSARPFVGVYSKEKSQHDTSRFMFPQQSLKLLSQICHIFKMQRSPAFLIKFFQDQIIWASIRIHFHFQYNLIYQIVNQDVNPTSTPELFSLVAFFTVKSKDKLRPDLAKDRRGAQIICTFSWRKWVTHKLAADAHARLCCCFISQEWVLRLSPTDHSPSQIYVTPPITCVWGAL